MHPTRLLALAVALLFPTMLPWAAAAQENTPAAAPVTPDDNLNAVLWMQHSVEYQASTMAAFALAKRRLIQAMGDPWWTAVPDVQKGNYSKLPPAIILDVDETLLDNSKYQAWNISSGKPFSNETWKAFVEAKVSTAIPGAVAFTRYANARGIKVFYVTNRTEDMEQATRDNMQALKFPMGGNVDTFLLSKEQSDWTSAKGTRRAFIAKDYRVLLLIGDNYGDFSDDFAKSEADRLASLQANMAHIGHDWIMIANPEYGSFESAPFLGDYKKSPAERRKMKIDALNAWSGPPQ